MDRYLTKRNGMKVLATLKWRTRLNTICGRQQPVSRPTLLWFFWLNILLQSAPATLVSWWPSLNTLDTLAPPPGFLVYLFAQVPRLLQTCTPTSSCSVSPFLVRLSRTPVPGFLPYSSLHLNLTTLQHPTYFTCFSYFSVSSPEAASSRKAKILACSVHYCIPSVPTIMGP